MPVLLLLRIALACSLGLAMQPSAASAATAKRPDTSISGTFRRLAPYKGPHAREFAAAIAKRLHTDNPHGSLGALKLTDAREHGGFAAVDAWSEKAGPAVFLLRQAPSGWQVLSYGTGFAEGDFKELGFPPSLYRALHPGE